MPRSPRIALGAVLPILSACTEDEPADTVDYADVAIVLRTHCVSCHQPEGLADFSLTTYEETAPRADAIVAATAARIMPPIPAVADGSCREFRDATWLDADELALLAAWAAAGAPPADDVDDVGELPPKPRLGDDALTLTLAEAYTPTPAANQQDEYRCFALDPSLDVPAVLTAAEFVPGNRELVHHIGLFAIDPDRDLGPFTNGEVIALMESDDPALGWNCFGGIGAAQPRSQVSGWSGGTAVVEMPEGSGMTLFAGELLVMQIHYRVHDDAAGQGDQTSIRLQLEADAASRVTAVFQDPITFATEGASTTTGMPSLPPRQDDARFEWELPITTLWDEYEAQEGTSVAGLRLLGVGPHMHNLGTALEFSVIAPEVDPICGLEVRHWDYAWQNTYFYDEPIVVTDRATRIRVTCHYDTTGVTAPVFAGHDAGREMCGLLSYVTAI